MIDAGMEEQVVVQALNRTDAPQREALLKQLKELKALRRKALAKERVQSLKAFAGKAKIKPLYSDNFSVIFYSFSSLPFKLLE